MPESRLEKTRATLPEGYQFGDGRYDQHCLWPYRRFVVDHGIEAMAAYQRGEVYSYPPCPVCGEKDHASCSTLTPLW